MPHEPGRRPTPSEQKSPARSRRPDCRARGAPFTGRSPLRALALAAGTALTPFALHAAAPGTPLGPESEVNPADLASDFGAGVASDPLGNSVVVWTGFASVSARRFSADGTAVGEIIEVEVPDVDPFISTNYLSAKVSLAADGSFVVVWWSSRSFMGVQFGENILARRYSATGEALGDGILIDPGFDPDVAADAAGNFVVTWKEGTSLVPGSSVARRYGSDGQARGDKITVDANATSGAPRVSMDAGGKFVIAWSQQPGADPSAVDVRARRYAANGSAQGAVFTANTFTAGIQSAPDIGLDSDGDFVIAWQSANQDAAGGSGIYAQRFAANGTRRGNEFRVNSFLPGSQSSPSVAVDADGDFAIAWVSAGQDGDGLGLYGRLYSAAGAARAGEFGLNSQIAGDQTEVAAAVDADGDLVVAWESAAFLASDVFARRFVGPEPVDLRMTKTASAAPVFVGDALQYRLSATNAHAGTTGRPAIDSAIGAATGVHISDPLPAGVQFLDAHGTDWSCSEAAGEVACVLTRPLLAGTSSSVVIDTAAPGTLGTIVNVGSVAAEQFDPIGANNLDSEPTTVVQVDTTPDAFKFKDRTLVTPLLPPYFSNVVTITGINSPSPISIAGTPEPMYSVNGAAFRNTPGLVNNGDRVQLRNRIPLIKKPGGQFLRAEATLNVGGVVDAWDLSVLP